MGATSGYIHHVLDTVLVGGQLGNSLYTAIFSIPLKPYKASKPL